MCKELIIGWNKCNHIFDNSPTYDKVYEPYQPYHKPYKQIPKIQPQIKRKLKGGLNND